MRILRLLLAGMIAAALLPVTGIAATAQGGTELYHCFETPGVLPMNANRPGYTYQSFSLLRSGCSACDEACDSAGARCISWSCFHPTFFGSIGGVQRRPIMCHLKSELPIPSPDPCAPPPRQPTYGNRVHDDRCYTSSQAPMTLPPRPERADGVQSTISIADPGFNANVAGELLAEAGLLNQILADPPPSELPQSISVLPECAGVLGLSWPPAVPGDGENLGVGPGLVTGPDARDAFEALRRDDLVAFTDFEDVPTGLHRKLTLDGPDGEVTVRLRTTEIRYPLPVKRAKKNAKVAILPYSFVSSPANHRLMGVQASKLPDGQSRYELVLSPPMSHVGLFRIWHTNSLTRFYNEAGALLSEHRNTTNNEFVGYVSDGLENLVRRIEFDGIPEQPKSKTNKLYQVGSVDDLYVGRIDASSTTHAGMPADTSSDADAPAEAPAAASASRPNSDPPPMQKDWQNEGRVWAWLPAEATVEDWLLQDPDAVVSEAKHIKSTLKTGTWYQVRIGSDGSQLFYDQGGTYLGTKPRSDTDRVEVRTWEGYAVEE